MPIETQDQARVDSEDLPLENGNGPASSSAEPGKIRHATWFSDRHLLVAGTLRSDTTQWPKATILLAGKAHAAEAQAVTYDVAGGPGADAPRGTLILVCCEPPGCLGEVPQRLVLGTGRGAAVFEPTHLPRELTDLSTLLRETVAGLDPGTRARVLRFLVTATADRLSGPGAARTSRMLFTAREALRERLPGPAIARGCSFGANVEFLFAVDANSFYVGGWVASTDAAVTRITAVAPEGCRVELLDQLFRHRRPDLDGLFGAASEDGEIRKLGFLGYFEVDTPSRLGEGWLVEVANASGEEIELVVPAAVRDPGTVRNSLLENLAHDPDGDTSLLPDHLARALRRIQERQRDQIRIEKVAQYGTPPRDPTVSIIIPLYGRIDFLEHQLAQFANDQQISQADVVYVLDSPELSSAIFAAAPRLERLYRVPFRVATLRSNVGFSGANNAGVSLGRGRLLLLLNPDVLPAGSGWLGCMTAFYDATPKVGAVGPKLLYEDDTIQHAGLFFYPEQGSGLWNNEHYYKGLHRTLPLANVTRPVPAVSAACMMIAADLYRELGGLSGVYVQGDYEDSDLCLRLSAAGRHNWYLSEVELYHLEGQSFPAALRLLTGRYNRWLHSRLWKEQIATVMQRHQ